MKVTQQQIDSFFIGKRIALAGVSRDTRKFSYGTFKNLTAKGYTILPVNPHTDKIDDIKCYRNVSDLPQNVDSLLIMTPKGKTDQTLREAIQKGIKNIWVQQMSETSQTLKIAEEYQREIIFKKCIYMFTEPVAGIHKFHHTLVKIFGRLPQ